MKNIILSIALLTFSLLGISQQINSAESSVSFSVSNFRVRTVEGSFGGMKGSVNFDPNDLGQSVFNVSIEVATINTENNKRDTHLKSEDFFEVETFPTISFVSKSITPKGDAYVASGTLTIKDVSKQVEIPFQVRPQGAGNILTGGLTVKRKEYKVGEGTSTFMVGSEIDVEISCLVE